MLFVGIVPFALRGYFRGFCREIFGLAGLVGGALGSTAGMPRLAAAMVARHLVSEVWAPPVAFVVLFVGIVMAANLLGRLAELLARAILLGWLNRAAGVAVGALKGAALLGFGLLAAEQLVVSPAFTERLAVSRLGRPLEALAKAVLETGRGLAVRAHA
jgi:membrane protein required for colicin V production